MVFSDSKAFNMYTSCLYIALSSNKEPRSINQSINDREYMAIRAHEDKPNFLSGGLEFRACATLPAHMRSQKTFALSDYLL